MEQTTHLWWFFVMVFGVIVLPGLDMAYVLASSLVGGRRRGLSATAGIMAGGAVHVAMGALGIMVVLQLWPRLFNLMLVAGAAYIAWIGISLLRSDAVMTEVVPSTGDRLRSQVATFGRGALTCLLNPKAYLFMLAVFPQFLRPEYGPLWLQAVVLGAIILVTQAGVYGGMALAAGQVRTWLRDRPRANRRLARGVGALLLLTALATAWGGWSSGGMTTAG